MASVLPETPVGAAPAACGEVLNGLAVGIVTLDYVRSVLGQALDADATALPAVQAMVDDAFHAGRLAPEDYATLLRDLGSGIDEDPPTEWSEDMLNEAAPASDTARPAPAVTDPDEPRASAALLYPGAVLRNRFVLQSRLKSGEMSEVFKALDRRRREAGVADPWVAIKLVTPGTPHYAEALKLLQQEAALSQRLQHPHIVQVFDFDRDEDYAFLTMEWLQGESLGDFLTCQRHRPVPPARARQILTAMGDALAFAHSRGVTHADVKPGNIYLRADGLAKLLDFGISRSVDDAGADSATAARTPAYASCEMLEGAAPTPQDDVFSLACVAYRMLAGRRAFGHHDALAAEQAGRKPSPVRALSSGQWAALARALAFRRSARTPDMATFMRDFNAATPATYAPAAPSPPAAQAGLAAPAPAASRRPAWASVATATLATAALAALLWMRPDTDNAAPAPPVAAQLPQAGELTPATPAALADAAHTAMTTGAPAPSPVTPSVPTPGASARVPTAAPGRASKQQPRAALVPRPAPALAADNPGDTASLPADPVAADEPLLAVAGSPTDPSPAAPQVAPAPAPADGTGDKDPPAAAGAAVDTTPVAPRQVPLADLEFTRYVEPKGRSLQSGLPGWVDLTFTVGKDGHPRDIAVVKSSPPGHYDEAALSAVRRWRFTPERDGDTVVERRTGVRLRFQPE